MPSLLVTCLNDEAKTARYPAVTVMMQCLWCKCVLVCCWLILLEGVFNILFLDEGGYSLTPCLNLLVSSDDKFLSVEQTAFQLFTFCPSGNSNQMQIFNLFIDNIGNDEKCTNARPCEPQILFALELWCAFFISRYNVFNCHTHWALPGALKYMLEKLYANQISNKLN